MADPTVFPSGLTNRPTRHLLSSLPMPDPTRQYAFFDDFAGFTTAAAGVAGWRPIAATGTLAAQVTGNGGFVAQTPQAAAAAFAMAQWSVGAASLPILRPTFGKKFWMSTRFKIAFGAQNNQFIGAAVGTVIDPFGTDPADKFAFRSLNAAPSALQFVMGPTTGAIVTIPMGTTLDNTFTVCSAFYDGKQTVNVQRLLDDGTVVAAGSVDVGVAGANFPDADMAPIFATQTKDGAASSVQTLDYIFFASER